MKLRYLLFSIAFLSTVANADSSTVDAAIGGGIGGAAGAAIGNELGGRDGAIIGGALGGAVGVAVNTEEESGRPLSPPPKPHYEYTPPREEHPRYYHCPPGQRKKGRC